MDGRDTISPDGIYVLFIVVFAFAFVVVFVMMLVAVVLLKLVFLTSFKAPIASNISANCAETTCSVQQQQRQINNTNPIKMNDGKIFPVVRRILLVFLFLVVGVVVLRMDDRK